jgi:NAD(P)-dependent dehydrogenase (short-subunit alcohol dehydrogenase family)
MTRVSIVTGGGLGIGGATSRRLAARGDIVVINDIDEHAASEARRDIAAHGGRCAVVVGDILEEDVVRRVVDTAIDAGGRIDVLVNNVGDFRPASRDFLHSRSGQWERLHELNLLHVLRLTHAVLPRMVEQGDGGAIVNNSTVEAFRGIPGHAVYSAYNAGVSAFTKSLAVEVGRHGIRVNAIAPDLADSEQTPAKLMLEGKDPDRLGTWVPLGRFGHIDEYAAVIEFLTSDAASYVTGHTVPVDGGTLAASGWYARVDGKGWTNFPQHA